MKTLSYVAVVLCLSSLSTALSAQERDVLGYGNFTWGTSLQIIKSNLDQQGIKYNIVDSSTRPGQKLLWANMLLSDGDGQFGPVLVKQTFTFKKDSLISISMKQELYDKKVRTRSYDTFKQFFSKQYKNTPEDLYIYKGSSEEVRGCSWKFPTTTLSLQAAPEGIFINYAAKKR